MITKGVYVVKPSCNVWTIEEFEYWEDLNNKFIIITKGFANGVKINMCLITKDQLKLFYRIGEL